MLVWIWCYLRSLAASGNHLIEKWHCKTRNVALAGQRRKNDVTQQLETTRSWGVDRGCFCWQSLSVWLLRWQSCLVEFVSGYESVSRICVQGNFHQSRDQWSKSLKTLRPLFLLFPANIYLFRVNKGNIETMCEICSQLTIKTPQWQHWKLWNVAK